MTNSEDSISQPQMVLPVELVTQVLQDYFAFRTAEVREVNARRLRESISGTSRLGPFGLPENNRCLHDLELRQHDLVPSPQWKVVPLLRTCKILSNIAVDELYRDIVVAYGPGTIYRLMSGPSLHSYQHIRTLDLLSHMDNSWADELEDCIPHRVMQSQALALTKVRLGRYWTSSADKFKRFSWYWSEAWKPRLKTLAIDSEHDHLLTCLLRL